MCSTRHLFLFISVLSLVPWIYRERVELRVYFFSEVVLPPPEGQFRCPIADGIQHSLRLLIFEANSPENFKIFLEFSRLKTGEKEVIRRSYKLFVTQYLSEKEITLHNSLVIFLATPFSTSFSRIFADMQRNEIIGIFWRMNLLAG